MKVPKRIADFLDEVGAVCAKHRLGLDVSICDAITVYDEDENELFEDVVFEVNGTWRSGVFARTYEREEGE